MVLRLKRIGAGFHMSWLTILSLLPSMRARGKFKYEELTTDNPFSVKFPLFGRE